MKDSIPLSKVCLYGYINWPLAQAHHQSSLGLSQEPKSIQRLGSSLMFRNSLCQILMVPPYQRNLTLILSIMALKSSRSQQEVYWPVTLTQGKKGAIGDIIPDVSQSSFSSSSSVVWVVTLPKFLDQWGSIISNSFVLNIVKGHHLELRYHPLLFHNFRWLTIKATFADHSIIQKEVDKLLAQDVIEWSTGGAGFSSNIFLFLSVQVAYVPYSTLSI